MDGVADSPKLLPKQPARVTDTPPSISAENPEDSGGTPAGFGGSACLIRQSDASRVPRLDRRYPADQPSGPSTEPGPQITGVAPGFRQGTGLRTAGFSLPSPFRTFGTYIRCGTDGVGQVVPRRRGVHNMNVRADSARSHSRGRHRRGRIGQRGVAVALLAVVIGVAAGCQPAPPTDPGHSRIDLRVLVVDDGSPMVDAITDQLATEGVPYTAVELSNSTRPVIDAGFLSSGSRAYFQAVVLPNERGGDLTNGLSTAEMDALHRFEVAFDIRQVDAYTYANVNVGLDTNVPNFNGDLDGVTATVTDAGKADGFGYLNGPVPFGVGSYASVAPPLPAGALPAGTAFTTLVSAPIPADGSTGSILGVYRNAGVEQLVITAAFEKHLKQFRALAHGIVSWATRGVHLGFNRNYFTVQVDDIFSSDALWDGEHHCTPGEDCPRDAEGNSIYPGTEVRMTVGDVQALLDWQQANDFHMQMIFNAGLAADDDPLTQALLAAKDQFWWVNHTWTHEFLGCEQDFTVIPWICKTDPVTHQMLWVPKSLILSQITQNIDWANANGVPFDPTELVSGEYSGLQIPGVQPADNPNFVEAIGETGIEWLASDVSRNELKPRQVNGATTVPRYPINIFYNAHTAAEEVSEYNWLYTSVADGGSGYCTDHPETTTCISPLDPNTGFTDYIVPLETSLRMPDVLHNDPRPIMIHATNLTGEHIAYPVMSSILSTYRSLVAPSAPIVSVTLSDAGEVQEQQEAWAESWSSSPGSPAAVEAYLQQGQVHLSGAFAGTVPVTVPTGTTVIGAGGSFGAAYGGEQSAWTTLPAGGLTLAIPAGTAANPLPPTAPTTVVALPTDSTTVHITWTPTAASGGRTFDYAVLATSDTAPGRAVVVPPDATSYTLTGLQAGAAYQVGVAAFSSAGSSAATPAFIPIPA